MRRIGGLIALSLLAFASACGRQESAAQGGGAAPVTQPRIEAAEQPRMVSGEGVIVAIDRVHFRLTLNQAALPEMGWPALTIGYPATGEMVSSLSVGDRVAFDLDLTGGGSLLTARKL